MSRFTKVDQKSLLKKKKRLYFGLGIIATLIVAISLTLFFSFKNTGAAWWNDSWMYRKLVPVTNNTTEESNVYISLTIDTSDTDKFQGDCGDLRFTNYGGNLLKYYISSGCTTATTVTHVFFETFPAGAQTIYYYYGNPSAANGSESSDFTTQASDYSIGTIGSQEKSPGPVAYWKLDEGYGTVANNSTAQTGINGTISGATWQTEDKCVNGKCLHFTSTDNINVPDASNNSLDFGTEDFTISTWVRTGTSADNRNLIRKGAGAGYSGWRFGLNNGIPNVLIGDTTGYASGSVGSTSIADNEWHLVTVVFNRDGNAVGYVDGKATGTVLSISTKNGSVDNSSAIIIGNSYATFTGFLDNIKMYNYARSVAEIKAEYISRGSTKGATTVIDEDPKWLSDGLIGYWKMDEAGWDGTSGEVIDSSGNGNNGTAGCGGTCTVPTTGGGKFGNGGVFDGTDDYVDINYANPVYSTSVIAWFKRSGTPAGGYHIITGGANVELSINDSGNYIRTGVVTDTQGRQVFNSGSGLTDGDWHQVALTYDGEKLNSYIDGAQTASNPVSGSLSGIASEIGRFLSNSYVTNGSIDEVRIYSRALSAFEISQLYSWAPGPLAYYNFDEGTGTTLYDRSGNGNNSTSFGGSPVWSLGKFDKSLSFSGTTDNVVIPLQNHKNITVSGWFKRDTLDASNADTIFGGWYWNADAQARQGYDLRFYNNQLTLNWVVETTNGATVTEKNISSGNLDLGIWYHATGTYDSESGISKLYINGSLVAESTATPGNTIVPQSQYSDMRIGYSRVNSGYFDGSIDELKVYNYARTPGQVVEDMNASHPIPGSPIGSQASHLKFDEGYGTTAYDVGYNGDDGILTDGPSWTNDGKFRKALDFDGLNDRVQGFAADPLEYTGEDLTLSVWINQDSGETTNGDIITKAWNGSGQYNYRLYINSNDTLTFSLHGATAWSTSTTDTIDTGNWHHIVVSVNGATDAVNIYIDGKLSKSDTYNITSWTPSSGDNDVSLCIGSLYPYNSGWAGNTTYSFDGKIDEVKIYTAALTQSQVLLDMNQGVSQVFGATSTDSSGNADWSASRSYCIPGDSTSCSAPVGEWKFDEKTGSSAYDTSGNGNDFTLQGSPGWDQGEAGAAIEFNGSSQYAEKTSPSSDLTLSTAGTFEAWVKSDIAGPGDDVSTYYRGIVTKVTGGGTGQQEFGLDWNGSSSSIGSLRGGVGTASSYSGLTHSYSFVVGEWTHIAFTWNASGKKLFINGEIVASNGVATTAQDISAPIRVSAAFSTGSTQIWDGSIDHVKIYDYARTPAQVAWDYNRGGPVGWWKMDECQGGTANDSSGNGNNGTITIGATVPQTAVGTCDTASTAWGNGAAGKYNSSLNFDGVDDYVDNTTLDNTNFPQTAGTISLWVKGALSTQGVKSIFDDWSSTRSHIFIRTRESSNNLQIRWMDSLGNYIAGTELAVPDNVWNLVSVTYDTTTDSAKIYTNGVLRYSGTMSDTLWVPSGQNVALSSATRFNGQIDDVQIYNYALTGEQIKILYNGGSALNFGP